LNFDHKFCSEEEPIFLPCQRVKINPNFKILLSYLSPVKSGLIFMNWQNKRKQNQNFKLGSSLVVVKL
jgi:hypothetical protein